MATPFSLRGARRLSVLNPWTLAPAHFAVRRLVDQCLDAAIYYQSREFSRRPQRNSRESPQWSGHYFLGVGYETSEKRSDAISEYQKAVTLADGDQDAAAALAHACAAAGKKIAAEKFFAILSRNQRRNTFPRT